MPRYLKPSAFVEEIDFRQRSIESVETNITGFVGPCRFGPVGGKPLLLTSYADFERIYGGLDQLQFAAQTASHNYLAQAVGVYFQEGGRKLYVSRIFLPLSGDDGIARWESAGSSPVSTQTNAVSISARYPGAAGDFAVTLIFKRGSSILVTDAGSGARFQGVGDKDVIWAQTIAEAQQSSPAAGQFYRVQGKGDAMRLQPGGAIEGDATGSLNADQLARAEIVTLTVTASASGQFTADQVWNDVTFDAADSASLMQIFAAEPGSARKAPLVFESSTSNGAELAGVLSQLGNLLDGTPVALCLDVENELARSVRLQLSQGNDGQQPTVGEYKGEVSASGSKSGLTVFEDLEDISLVAAPGSTHDYTHEGGTVANAVPVMQQLIAHCERLRHRFAVLDSIDGQLPADVQQTRRSIDTSLAALYYPWLRISDPVSGVEIDNPPSGHLCGIYARNDIERGVHKAPANVVIRSATGLELLLNRAQQRLLNPDGINCLRFFPRRGYRVWGARTTSSDAEWRYVNVRRYSIYLERSIEAGTQWVVFENNTEPLWSQIRTTIENFLLVEWKRGCMVGSQPEQAFFVRCDRSTMKQSDLAHGRVVCVVGVALIRPAEFIILRIAQKTADATA